MLNEKPTDKRLAGLDINTIAIFKDNMNLTAYWIENHEVQTKTLKEKDVKEVVYKLPSPNQKSIDKNLIQAVISKYGCTPQDIQTLLAKMVTTQGNRM